MKNLLATIAITGLFTATPTEAADPSIPIIVDEGMNHSQLPIVAHELFDRIGHRLTNSPNMRRAENWAIAKMQDYGLQSIHKEGFEFGRGWEMVDAEVDMLAPRPLELTATAVAWTPGTNGAIDAEIVVAPMSHPGHFDAYRGKLNGKIVLISLPGTGDQPTEPAFKRWSASELADMDQYVSATSDPDADAASLSMSDPSRAIDEFLASEGALAVVTESYRDGKLLHGSGYRHRIGDTPRLPYIEMAAEDYRRLARLAKLGAPPRLRIDSRVRWYDDDPNAYNIIGDIPGTDAGPAYVMAGAHFDSWATADGAVDNGAGSLIVLEAARILKALNVKPKRTIRFALWSGEEQGVYGSLAYADQHLASRPTSPLDYVMNYRLRYSSAFPIRKKEGFDHLKAYFNFDNGSGRIRGIYAENNLAAEPLLKKWLSSFAKFDAARVATAETTGTDHIFFQDLGLPAFQFIQDPLDYGSRLHHTNIDTLDHLQFDDLRQAAVILAGMLWQAANSEETLPVEPLPRQREASDPFTYKYP